MSEPQPTPVIIVKPPSPESLWVEMSIAVNYLTRFSLPFKDEPKSALVSRSVLWFPIVGALIGLAGASVDWIMTLMRMPSVITATAAVVSMLFVTRALHEEELASLIDTYGRSVDKSSKVGWLKEKRSVPYGTLGIIMIIILKIGAIASLSDNTLVFQTLIVASSWSRALMVVATGWLTPIEGDPVADHFQKPPALRAILAVVIAIVIAYSALDEDTATVLTASTIAGLIVALIGANHLRGYNGALLGSLQQIVEVTVFGIILAIQ
jgi:adenosylcobinamide-GDP ribazoletransferase